jgi:hypothetical protein
MNLVGGLRKLVEPKDEELARKMMEAEQCVEKAMKTIQYTEEELRNEPSTDLMLIERGKTVARTILKRDLGKFEKLDVCSCDNCGEVHKHDLTTCNCCGAKLSGRVKTAYKIIPEEVLRKNSPSSEWRRFESSDSGTTFTGLMRSGAVGVMVDGVQASLERPVTQSVEEFPSMQNTLFQAFGQITIQSDDGDVQVESFSFNPDSPGLASMTNTGQSFFVARKPGCIVDMIVPAVSGKTTAMTFIVNGRNTGVTKMLAGMVPTVNSRMPVKLPIMGGAAVQLRMH